MRVLLSTYEPRGDVEPMVEIAVQATAVMPSGVWR
jgi:hypothetical protein